MNKSCTCLVFFCFYCLTLLKNSQNAAYFSPNSSQGPFPKIAGKGPEYTACKYLRQMLANRQIPQLLCS